MGVLCLYRVGMQTNNFAVINYIYYPISTTTYPCSHSNNSEVQRIPFEHDDGRANCTAFITCPGRKQKLVNVPSINITSTSYDNDLNRKRSRLLPHKIINQ